MFLKLILLASAVIFGFLAAPPPLALLVAAVLGMTSCLGLDVLRDLHRLNARRTRLAASRGRHPPPAAMGMRATGWWRRFGWVFPAASLGFFMAGILVSALVSLSPCYLGVRRPSDFLPYLWAFYLFLAGIFFAYLGIRLGRGGWRLFAIFGLLLNGHWFLGLVQRLEHLRAYYLTH